MILALIEKQIVDFIYDRDFMLREDLRAYIRELVSDADEIEIDSFIDILVEVETLQELRFDGKNGPRRIYFHGAVQIFR